MRYMTIGGAQWQVRSTIILHIGPRQRTFDVVSREITLSYPASGDGETVRGFMVVAAPSSLAEGPDPTYFGIHKTGGEALAAALAFYPGAQEAYAEAYDL